MAYLSKEQYAYRRESAARRNINNMEIAVENGMTEEQAELIYELCSTRHELHTSGNSKYYNNTYECRDLIDLNIRIEESGLDPMDFVPTDKYDYIDIDDFDTLFETEQVPDDDDERDKWYEEHFEEISEQWEELNGNIERYLKEIDKKYNTSFCPIGALRVS